MMMSDKARSRKLNKHIQARKPAPRRVQLSLEGQERLSPRIPMRGTVVGYLDGLVTLQEDSGAVADYHPDFIEPMQAVPRG